MFRAQSNSIILCILLFAVSLFVFSRGLSIHGAEYRDDEVFYFKSTQEMVHGGNLLSPIYFGEDRFQKPILYYWLVIASYKVFGINWFGARFVAVFFAALTVCLTWLIGKELFEKKTAILAALNIASEYFQIVKERDELLGECEIVASFYSDDHTWQGLVHRDHGEWSGWDGTLIANDGGERAAELLAKIREATNG